MAEPGPTRLVNGGTSYSEIRKETCCRPREHSRYNFYVVVFERHIVNTKQNISANGRADDGEDILFSLIALQKMLC